MAHPAQSNSSSSSSSSNSNSRGSALRGSASRREPGLINVVPAIDIANADLEREKVIRQMYATIASFRDGERNQTVTIIERLIPRAIEKKHDKIYGKWSGGLSMSESPNDKGKGLHPVLHKGYGDAKFKYKKVYPDLPR